MKQAIKTKPGRTSARPARESLRKEARNPSASPLHQVSSRRPAGPRGGGGGGVGETRSLARAWEALAAHGLRKVQGLCPQRRRRAGTRPKPARGGPGQPLVPAQALQGPGKPGVKTAQVIYSRRFQSVFFITMFIKINGRWPFLPLPLQPGCRQVFTRRRLPFVRLIFLFSKKCHECAQG